MKADAKRGMMFIDIAKKYKVHNDTVKRHCKGLARRRGHNKQSAKWTAAMKEADVFITKNAPVKIRQTYYHLVAHGLIPKDDNMCHYLGGLINQERRKGKYRGMIIDTGSQPSGGDYGFRTPESYIETEIDSIEFGGYCRRAWRGQPKYIEVWIEKEALENIISPTCTKSRVKYLAAGGFSSLTTIENGLKRFPNDKEIEILLVTDEDPSGRYMEIALQKNIDDFNTQGLDVKVTRIALTQTQISKYGKGNMGIPRNPKDKHPYPFKEVWELDCLEPDELKALIKEEIDARIDVDIWNKNQEEQKAEKKKLEEFRSSIADYLDEVRDELESKWNNFKEEKKIEDSSSTP